MNFEPHLRACDNEAAGSVCTNRMTARGTSSRFYLHVHNDARLWNRRTRWQLENWSRGPRLLSSNRGRFVLVTVFLTGHNSLRRLLHSWGLMGSLLCGSQGGEEEETPVHVLCECEALATLRHTHLGSLFVDSVDIGSPGVMWNVMKGTGLPWFGQRSKRDKRPYQGDVHRGHTGLEPIIHSTLWADRVS